MVYKLWTQRETDYLKNNYGKKTTKEISKYLNRGEYLIRCKASKLNLKAKCWWEKEEIKYLIENYRKKPIKEIMISLNRSLDSIRWKASKLKLKSGKLLTQEEFDFLEENFRNKTYGEIALKLGKNYNAIQGMAIKQGLIKREVLIFSKDYDVLNKNLAYVLGVVLGDGWVGERKIRLNCKDKDFALEFKKQLKNWSNLNISSYIYFKKGDKQRFYFTICLYSLQASKFIKSFIDGRLNEILTTNKEIQVSFLKGLYDSEGGVCSSKATSFFKTSISFTNTNLELIKLVSLLLFKLGFKNPKIYTSKKLYGNQKKIVHYIYLRRFYDKLLFYQDIGFSIKRKQDKLVEVLNYAKNREHKNQLNKILENKNDLHPI